nr:hypothetical protein HK105_003625 [Polyrhizophydium stewartii]
MLLAAGEPQSPASHAQALIDERAALGRGEELSISAWQRRGSESNTTLSSLAPEQLGADRLTWLQEAREHDPTLSAAVDAIAGNFRRAPRPMSEDTLLERALHRSSSVSSTSARTSVSSYSALLRNISAQHLAAESGAGPSAAPAPTSLRPPLPEMSSRAAARNKLSVDTLTSVDVPSAATELTPTRASVSSRKITAIFGEACPVDISTTQIERKGLWALLLSNLPLCYFLLYLLRKHTAEILFFVLDAHDFEQTVFESNTQLQRSAQDLFGLYLAKDALFELNVSHKVRRAVADGIQSSSLSCFARAQQEMMRLLDESFTEFKGSAEFAQMKRELGPHSVMHHESTATHVAQMLRSAVPAQVKALGDHRKRQLMAVRGRVDILIDDCLTPYFFARPQLRA